MYFKPDATCSDIFSWATDQINAIRPLCKNGILVDIKPYRKPRSNEQNRFLMAIMQEIVRFYHDTGFMPEGCQRWMMRVDILKEFYKAKLGIEHTSKLSTAEFTKFIDAIQLELVEQTHGEWQILTTDSAYLKSLTGEL